MNWIVLYTGIFIFDSDPSNFLHQKYPHAVLSKDYGILTEDDVLYDMKNENPRPYEIFQNQWGYNRWQCFHKDQIKFYYYTWYDSEYLDSSKARPDNMCDFFFKISQESIWHTYMDRRARNIEHCRWVHSIWKKLTKNEDYVCLNGEPYALEVTSKYWVWNKFKTKKGCHSLFAGMCDTASVHTSEPHGGLFPVTPFMH